MSRTKLFFILIVIPVLALFSYKATFSFFSNQATSINNIFAAASAFPSPSPTGNIVINEIFEAPQNQDEWIELHNPTDSSIDIGSWKITDANANSNGQDDNIPTGITIPAGGYAVIVGNNSNVVVPSSAIEIELTSANIGNGLNGEGDAVILKNSSSVVIDQMSYGDNTDIFATPPGAPGTTQSVARIPNGIDTNSASDWSLDSSPTLGTANAL